MIGISQSIMNYEGINSHIKVVHRLLSIGKTTCGAMPRMGPHPITPALFGSCLFYFIYLWGAPNKAVKKKLAPSLLNTRHMLQLIFGFS